MAQTIAQIKNELVNKAIAAFVYGDKRAAGPGYYEPRKVTAQYLCEDGRTRKKFWKELIAGGYITQHFNNYPVEDGVAYFTDKAFDELAAADVDLTTFYKFDAWDAHKGIGDYISWDRLNSAQKKTVILAMRADPASFTLMMVDWRSNPVVKQPFPLGDASGIKDRSDMTFSVSSPALVALHLKHKRDQYKQECLEKGLNWFLHSIKAIEPEQTVPVSSKQPGLWGGGPAISCEPTKWAESLPATIEATKQRIQEARAKLETLQRMEAAVDAAGGWEAFMAQYDAAVEAYVEENAAKV